MAYNANSYFPTNHQYPQFQSQYQQPYQPVQQNSNTLTWIQGESAAKSFPVTPGGSVLLLDSEAPVFYIKTVDSSGMPQPLRVFDYTERQTAVKSEPETKVEYITREEFEERLNQLSKVPEPAKTPVRREKANA